MTIQEAASEFTIEKKEEFNELIILCEGGQKATMSVSEICLLA